jgi:hypothetical protein
MYALQVRTDKYWQVLGSVRDAPGSWPGPVSGHDGDNMISAF